MPRYSRKRRSAYRRGLKNGPGLAMKGARMIRMKYCTQVTLSTDGTISNRLKTANSGFKANSIRTPGDQFGDTFDAFGSDQAQYIYNRYRVVKSTISIESLRKTANSNDVLMAGINLTEPGANEGVIGTTVDPDRGTDLVFNAVLRDQYRQKPGLIGAGKTNIINDSNSFRHKWTATFKSGKFFRGNREKKIGQDAGLIPAGVSSAAAPGTLIPLNTIKPEDPDNIVYFQPWVCKATGGGAQAVQSVDVLITINYWVMCTGKKNMPIGQS